MNTSTVIAATCLLFSFSPFTATFAADPVNGRALSRQCTVCHGKTGVANDPEVPNLAGQSAFYLEKSMKDYRSGVREDRRMTLMAANLTDDQIKDIAAWYASFKIEVTVPEQE